MNVSPRLITCERWRKVERWKGGTVCLFASTITAPKTFKRGTNICLLPTHSDLITLSSFCSFLCLFKKRQVSPISQKAKPSFFGGTIADTLDWLTSKVKSRLEGFLCHRCSRFIAKQNTVLTIIPNWDKTSETFTHNCQSRSVHVFRGHVMFWMIT